jgi:hypothetical protein
MLVPTVNPDIWMLCKFRWQFFGTLTFIQERLPENVRMKMLFAFLRTIADKYKIHFSRLLWCVRYELGEITGRPHFHYLLGGLPPVSMNASFNLLQMEEWEMLGGGMARVHVFNQRLNGVGYITKCLDGSGPETGKLGGDSYESAKFGGITELMLSRSGAEAMRRGALR